MSSNEVGRTELTAQNVTVAEIAKMLDHSLLKPELTVDEVRAGCEQAGHYQVMSVCVRPSDVPLAVELLSGTGVRVGTVIGFPHGSTSTEIKAAEVRLALSQGATEFDMVQAIGRLRSGDQAYVEADIRAVVEAADGLIVKVILENGYLTDAQKVVGCQIAERAGAAFVKTSTGFAPTGATMADLALMRSTVSEGVGVKAAGGVRSLDTLLAMANIGVTRFGATASPAILDDLEHRQKYGEPLGEAVAPGNDY
ncbi:MAG TPA: deoxyribose-phosphate aldolase [Micromonosporaceae bacterium]|jgi:deoxyribose-phosphate aldolase